MVSIVFSTAIITNLHKSVKFNCGDGQWFVVSGLGFRLVSGFWFLVCGLWVGDFLFSIVLDD